MIAIVVSQFNAEITDKLLEGCLERLKSQEVSVFRVPGAVEIPLVCLKLAKTNKFKALIALGAVIRGETTHYDYVCEMVSQGCNRVSLENEIPVIFGVLTTENDEQALDRVGGKHGHKGRDAADAALSMIDLLADLNKI